MAMRRSSSKWSRSLSTSNVAIRRSATVLLSLLLLLSLCYYCAFERARVRRLASLLYLSITLTPYERVVRLLLQYLVCHRIAHHPPSIRSSIHSPHPSIHPSYQ